MVMKIIKGMERHVPPYDDDDIYMYHMKGGLIQKMDEGIFWITDDCKKRINEFILSEINNEQNRKKAK